MTAWHKEASGSALSPPTPTNGAAHGMERSSPIAWEDWFRHAGPQQRAVALGLAQRQGFLYSHQLPAIANGKTPPAAESPASVLLPQVLAGKIDTLPPLADAPAAFADAELDDVQRQAVARALASPDLFMLQGLPGTGKSRVLAEIIRQAASRGWRTLFLAGHTASVDVVLERLQGTPEILAVRLLEGTEKPDALPDWLRGLTLDEQKKAFCRRVESGALGNRERVETACRRMSEQTPLWADLESCALRWTALQDRRRTAAAVHGQTGGQETPTPASPESTSMADGLRSQREALARCEMSIASLTARIGELEPAFLAKTQHHFWTGAFWRHLFSGNIVQEMESARRQLADASAEKESLLRQITEVERQIAEERARRRQEEAARAQAAATARQESERREREALAEEERRLDEEWSARCQALDIGAIDKSAEAIVAARAGWLAKKARSEEECQFAHQWSNFVAESAGQWANRLASFANLLAGSIGRWYADGKFREAAGGPFDLVIVEDADALTEADVIKLARQGGRCVLVASAILPPSTEKSPRSGPKLTASACWHRLWQALGGDAGVCPHRWQRDEDRLVCQLIPLSDDDRQYLEHEGLADAPDIELGILHRPSSRPCLAQVSFGPDRPFAEAFAFMVREVQEFPLQPLGRTAWWREDERTVCRHFGPGNGNIQCWHDIEAGMRLGAAEAARVVAIEFHKSAGWDRTSADAWLARHRPIRDHERTACLQVPYRFAPTLAKLITGVVRHGEWVGPHAVDEKPGAGCEFIPVSAPPGREPASLELDLSVAKSADKLPAGLRHGLPAAGFVNYAEAQALIRRLETWSQNEATEHTRAAILALYEAQATLLRRLVEQSEILRGRRHPLEIALPSKTHQREFDAVFLSLTRSQPHRPPAFGDDPRELPTALTRAKSRLFIFGDRATIAARSQTPEPDCLTRLAMHVS